MCCVFVCVVMMMVSDVLGMLMCVVVVLMFVDVDVMLLGVV